MSLRLKVLLILSLVFLVGGFWSYRTVYDNIRPQYLRVMEDGMVDQTYLLARQIEAMLPDKDPEAAIPKLPIKAIMSRVNRAKIRARIYEWEKQKLDFRIYITDSKGTVRLDSDNGRDVGKDYSQWNDVYKALQGKYGGRSSREQDSYGRNINSLYTAFPIYKGKRRKPVGVLALVKSKASLMGWAERAQAKLWKGVLLGASALFILALILTQLALMPIFRLTQYARDITAGRRIDPPPTGSDEIGMLTQAFIEMKRALWKRQDIEAFVTQLTHELKSPICAIQGAAELLEDAEMPLEDRSYFLNNIEEQSRRMDDIVQRLLRLVSLEQRESLDNKEAIEVSELLDDAEQRFRTLAQRRRIKLQFHPIEAATQRLPALAGDRFLLEQALANLLQNSFHFTPEGGNIDVSVTCEEMPEGTAYKFEIVDTGPGIPGYATNRVMEKFYSLEHPDSGKKGTGLGLPFVQQVALLHGGEFTLSNGKEQGAVATLWLRIE